MDFFPRFSSLCTGIGGTVLWHGIATLPSFLLIRHHFILGLYEAANETRNNRQNPFFQRLNFVCFRPFLYHDVNFLIIAVHFMPTTERLRFQPKLDTNRSKLKLIILGLSSFPLNFWLFLMIFQSGRSRKVWF